MRKAIFAIPFLFALFALTACDMQPTPPSADHVQRAQQEQLSQQANAIVGMPAVVNFSEKKMLKDIIELRDKMPPTYTYITDMNGHLHKICDSIGYGFSGATQFTNPSKIDWRGGGSAGYASGVIPQADPNGLFSPAADEGTWILCKNPHGKEVLPIRMEPRSIISPFALD